MSDPMPEIAVEHDAASSRFRVRLEGYEACLMYRQQGQVIDLYHTYVPQVFRGRGVAERLCKAAFEHAKAQGLTVIPSCSYISDAYLRRHPEYEPLVRRGPPSNPTVSG
jgi:predicted GNAT family acetyltransferase